MSGDAAVAPADTFGNFGYDIMYVLNHTNTIVGGRAPFK